MRFAAFALTLLLAGCGGQPTPKFADIAITLPEDTAEFPDHPGKDAMIANCGACHSPSMILTQPRLTADQWKGTIKKMREVYKAPVNAADEPAILAYLKATSAAVR